jgi:acyl-CoA synthetase (AMP-forming)/AMP-acid ligase II
MLGTMMRYPLTLNHLLERGRTLFPEIEVVSRLPGRGIARSTYADFARRARALAEMLQKAGLQRGDRVATLMWNHYVHMEAYFGVPAAGGVLHTLNLRLAPHELAYIVNHAEDRMLIVDDTLLPLFESFAKDVKLERVFVVRLSGEPLPPAYDDYETFISQATGEFRYADIDENEAAGMCYTSGTTGTPKGVVYSHRSLVLHGIAFCLPDAFCLSQHDVLMALAPMFHVNAHSVPQVAVMTGAKLVFPGRYLDAESVLELFQSEKVTWASAVPTVWLGIQQALESQPGRWKLAPGMRGMVGGSAAPESLFRNMDRLGIRLTHAWGMTETSPIVTAGTLKSHMQSWPQDKQYEIRARQGRPSPFMEVRTVALDDPLPWDGATPGELQTRGPWVASGYYKMPEERGRWTDDGWLRTGDVANIDPEGYVKIVDRTKDLIKSGGEWISSVDLENAIVAHPDVREAAVIAVTHPKWQERPLAVVVPRDGTKLNDQELRTFLAPRFASWQLPDAFVFVSELPHTSTGKLLKSALRKQFKDWAWEKAGS